MTEEIFECNICGKKLDLETAIFFNKDLWINPEYSEPTDVYCKVCAEENLLI